MSEMYTPTTEQVRLKFAYEPRPANGTSPTLMADFDLWLDQERAVARREGMADGWDEGYRSGQSDHCDAYDCEVAGYNPHWNGEDRHVDQ